MKQKKENKLHLGKATIQNLQNVLERAEQKKINGGNKEGSPNTDVPQYC